MYDAAVVGSFPWGRGLIAGVAGGLAWLAGILLIFGPAQSILADPGLQSAKFLMAFTSEPAPLISTRPWVLPLGLIGIGVLWGWVYAWLSGSWSGAWWQRGLRFGGVAWVMMVPWFEFYLPWNVLREPAALVMLEMLCWAGVLMGVGLAMAGVDAALRRREGLRRGENRSVAGTEG